MNLLFTWTDSGSSLDRWGLTLLLVLSGYCSDPRTGYWILFLSGTSQFSNGISASGIVTGSMSPQAAVTPIMEHCCCHRSAWGSSPARLQPKLRPLVFVTKPATAFQKGCTLLQRQSGACCAIDVLALAHTPPSARRGNEPAVGKVPVPGALMWGPPRHSLEQP